MSAHSTAVPPTVHRCTVCGEDQARTFVHVPNVPVLCNVLWSTQEAAQGVRRVDVDLAFCTNCGHIFNPAFDLGLMDYTQVYENSLHYSARFQEYADSLAQELVDRHDLHDKDIIEIGSGKGDFLEMLCELGDNRGVGYDPSYIPGETERSKTEQITFVQDFYSEDYADQVADFICCRHTLEHIPDPRSFLQMLRRTIGDRSDITVFFEVPNALFTLQDLAIWDIIYEHCSYFTGYSLAYLFAEAGFQVTDVRPTFGGQFLTIEAVPADGDTRAELTEWNDPAAIAGDVESFAQRYRAKVAEENALLEQMQAGDQRAVIWGAGSKGITFLNVLDPGDRVTCAVDINPRKQGMFITGAGQPIVGPQALQEAQPDVVIVMNPIYMDEIRATVAEMGVDAEFVTV